ncbi:hypothetical protein [Lysinibacillus sp. NPDC056232]|uniref:hypothetical protein n=1 Tax=Lysinibacillus sp. NPDC056232 TaxID=3345756 RepID=UPI0035DB3480
MRRRSDSNNNTMLVTKALSQGVMLLAFVPQLALTYYTVPKEAPSRNGKRPHALVISQKIKSAKNRQYFGEENH